jgi:hypothetical protein
MERNGFINNSRQVFDPRPDLVPGYTIMWYLIADEVVRSGFEEPTRSVLHQLIQGAYSETRDKSLSFMFKPSPAMTIGKKPSQGTIPEN